MHASSRPAARLAAAAVLATGTLLAGCDRKPTDPPKPSAALAVPGAGTAATSTAGRPAEPPG